MWKAVSFSQSLSFYNILNADFSFFLDIHNMSANLYKIKAKSDGTGPWFELTSCEGRIFIFKYADGNYYCQCSADNHAIFPGIFKRGKALADHMIKMKSTWCGSEPIIPFEVGSLLSLIN